MARKGSRPGGAPRPARSRRPGRAGVGPGPAYRPSSSGGGTSHKSSTATRRQALAASLAFIALPLGVVSGLGAFLLHGYGAF